MRDTTTALVTVCLLAAGLAAAPIAAAGPIRFLYASGAASGKVAALAIAPDATLRPIPGSPFPAGTGGLAIAVTPDGRHVYVPSLATADVSAFAVGTGGWLTPVPDSPFAAGAPAGAHAFSPDGRRLYVTTTADGGTIRGWAVGPDGSLSPLADSPTNAGGRGTLASIAMAPDGRHLYAASYLGQTIATYAVAPDGRLRRAPGEPTATGLGSVWPSITPDGRYLYASNESDDTVSAFAIGADGALTPVPGSPFPTGDLPHPTEITPDGRFLYVPNVNANTISAYTITADGALKPVAGSPFPAGEPGTSPGSLAVAPGGRHIYLTEIGTLQPAGARSSRVRVYAIRADGALQALDAAPVATGVVFSDGDSSTITPNQGPTAAFSVKRRRGSRRVTFSAKPSRDDDGRVVRYAWSFGDGARPASRRPTEAHTYRRRGTYEVTLTVTDDEGCSTRPIFTGQTALCNGGPRARATRRVTR